MTLLNTSKFSITSSLSEQVARPFSSERKVVNRNSLEYEKYEDAYLAMTLPSIEDEGEFVDFVYDPSA